MNYYNEHDPKAAQWLRELIKAKLIPDGVVDERSITDVTPNDLVRFTQCHFFAGIGGWSYALRLAGWPEDRPVWTGSCPCQPFSVAGKRLGEKDERHLWPVFRELIRACQPPVIFGEQVASAAVLGRVSRKAQQKAEIEAVWLDGIFADLENAHYTCGAADIPAASVGAPHIRQRLFWVAYAMCERRGRWGECKERSGESGEANTAERGALLAEVEGLRVSGGMGDSIQSRLEGHTGNESDRNEPGWNGTEAARSITKASRPWNSFELIPCLDGKARRIEPGTCPLAHGVSGRVGLLRGYGNAIVPQVAAEFIQAAEEAIASISDHTNRKGSNFQAGTGQRRCA